MRPIAPLVAAATAAAILLPASMSAQSASLRISGGESSTVVEADRSRGYNAYPATALTALGAELIRTPRGVKASLLGDTLTFEVHSPIFFDAANPRQLAAPVYRIGGEVYIPGQLFTDWLPSARGEFVGYEGGTLLLRKKAPGRRDGAEGKRRAPAPRRGEAVDSAALAKRVVIIDPGHGGADPGKIGPGGMREKDIALSISRSLAEALEKRGGFEVHLTRTTDTLIALADRPKMANRWKGNRPAALFISIHANSASNRNARGFETFFLSDARTEDERRVAEMENAAVAYETPAADAPKDDLDWIFNTLRNDFYVRASNDLAEAIQKSLATVHPGPNRGVKQAGFRVLVGAFMPAVLVETAFISNSRDAALLEDRSFQRKVAGALADAVEEYFISHEHLWASDPTQTTPAEKR